MSNMTFPNPKDLETIPGTEGWERMYPYQYQFGKEDSDRTKYEEETFWFYDGLHYPEPVYPFDTIVDEGWFLALSQYNTRIFSLPPVLGVDHRMVNGYVYISPVPVKDPAEVEGRVADFMERAGYYYENWGDIEKKWEKKMENTIADLSAVEVPVPSELEDISVVKENIGVSKGYALLKAYDDIIDLNIRTWQYHFEMLNLGYVAYVTFMGQCNELFPDIKALSVTQMVAGLDVIMYRPDEELKKLAQLAVDLNVDETVKQGSEFDGVKAALEDSDGGQKWLAAFEESRYPWFYVSNGGGMSHKDKCWNDNLDVPLGSIQMYIDKLLDGENIDRPMDEVQEERDRITAEYRALIENDEDRAAFDQNLASAKMVFPYVENHMFYVEHWFHSVFWNKIREFGAIMKDHGFLEDVEDIWFLKRSEVKEALWDLVTAWATGVHPRGPEVWPKEIEWRKGVREKFAEWAPAPALGPAPETIQEPFTTMLWGVTDESLENWAELDNGGDLTEIKGFAGSPGSVEGKVRVCRTVDEVGQLEEGEILVAPTTSPSWAPAFNKIQACVTDVGGVMCHAAIVCREYGMPAVVGTGQATKLLQTGQMVRVDGGTGQIAIL